MPSNTMDHNCVLSAVEAYDTEPHRLANDQPARAQSPISAPSKPRSSKRQPELDALRGLMLILMTLAHLPTQAQVITNQQLGFISEAEGFIFLSAYLTGRIFAPIADEFGFPAVIKRLWTRALRLYGYHLLVLGIAFSVVATIAIYTRRPALEGLLDFYLANPIHAAYNAVFLIYCPPLLDILPMYIIFLFASPIALYIGRRWSWTPLLVTSGMIWALAQFGLRAAVHSALVRSAGLQVPLNEMGAFDLLAWQFLWITGLWIGAGIPGNIGKALTSKISMIVAFIMAVSIFLLRHPMSPSAFDGLFSSALVDKWHLGALRLFDFTSLAILFAASRHWLARWLAIPPLVVFGQASLQVFCAHLLFCFAALSFAPDGTAMPVWIQAALIAATFLGLYTVARFAKPRIRAMRVTAQ